MRIIGSVLRSLRERREVAVQPPKLPAVDERVHRSRLWAATQARLAVRSGVRLEDFLRFRLARYAEHLKVPFDDLPASIAIEDGDVVVRARPPARSAAFAPNSPGRPDEPRWMKPLVQRDGPSAARDIHEAEEALTALDARAAAERQRIAAIGRALQEDLASGALVSPPRVEASAEQLGRPPVAPPWPIQSLRGFVAALLVAETWQLSKPVLAASGIAGDDLVAAYHANPVGLVLGAVFALGAAAAVFVLMHVAVRSAFELATDAATPRRRAWLGAGAAGATLVAGAVAASPATPGAWALVGLLVIVPLAGILLLRIARGLEVARQGEADAALAWDRARCSEAAERGKREELLARAEAELADIEGTRAAAARRLRTLHRRALEIERVTGEASSTHARRLERLTDALAAALELDRYAFVRLAADHGSASLTAPARPPPRSRDVVPAERLGVAG